MYRRSSEELKAVQEAHQKANSALSELERKEEEQRHVLNSKNKVIRQLQGQLEATLLRLENS